MRMSLRYWRSQFFPMPTVQQRAREPKPEKARQENLPWSIVLPDGKRLVVNALTKSEARADAKRHFRLSRLPVGTVVSRSAA